MPKGGRRPGAGRKKGTTNSRANERRELALRLATEGITPLEIMRDAMLHFHKKGDRLQAVSIAKDMAPYVHPRLQAQVLAPPEETKPTQITYRWAPPKSSEKSSMPPGPANSDSTIAASDTKASVVQ